MRTPSLSLIEAQPSSSFLAPMAARGQGVKSVQGPLSVFGLQESLRRSQHVRGWWWGFAWNKRRLESCPTAV